MPAFVTTYAIGSDVGSLIVPRIRSTPLLRRCTCRRRLQFKMQSSPSRDELDATLRKGSQGEQMLALIALPSLPSPESVALMHSTGILRSENRQVRLTAVATLGKLGMLSEGRTLLAVLRNDMDEDYSVRAAAANALGILLEPSEAPGGEALVREAVNTLVHAVTTDENFIVRYASIVSLGNIGQSSALSTLLPLAKDENALPLEASASIEAIGEIVSREDVTPDLIRVITHRAGDQEQFVRAAVARTLGRWKGVGDAVRVLEKMKAEEHRVGKSPMVLAVLADVLG